MDHVAIWAVVESKREKEDEVEAFLKSPIHRRKGSGDDQLVCGKNWSVEFGILIRFRTKRRWRTDGCDSQALARRHPISLRENGNTPLSFLGFERQGSMARQKAIKIGLIVAIELSEVNFARRENDLRGLLADVLRKAGMGAERIASGVLPTH